MVLPPLLLAFSPYVHQFQNVIRGTDLDPIEEVTSLRPAVGVRFVTYALPRGEFGDLP